MSSPRIFVQIASYRDPECQWTVRDLFEKANEPDRIDVGICSQFIAEEDADLFRIKTRPQQVRTVDVDARESQGVGHARTLAHQLYDGQQFYLQIDSHMRFTEGWDDLLIRMLGECDSPKPALTTYPPGYVPPNTLHPRLLIMLPKKFDPSNLLLFRSRSVPLERAPKQPVRGACLAGGFIFADAKFIGEVPADPHIYFFGEELSLALRSYTHGWDLFHPHKIVVYHYWSRSQRKTHFDDHRDWGIPNRRSKQRVAHLVGQEISADPNVLVDIEKYGLGSVRTVEQWEELACVNLRERKIFPNPLESLFNPTRSSSPIRATNAIPNETIASSVGGSTIRVSAATAVAKGQAQSNPRIVFESSQAIVVDNFLPQEEYADVYRHACVCDYEFINTSGTVRDACRLRDGFPLRSEKSIYHHVDPKERTDKDLHYPNSTPFDKFIDCMNKWLPNAESMVGKGGTDWGHFTVTSWIYPRNTGLSLHTDGNSYSGAYVYFLNSFWNIHWGGLLMILDPATDARIANHQRSGDAIKYHRMRWADESEENDLVWEPGFAKCIFPKTNRLVIFGGATHHMVTTVNDGAGDNVLRSFAGFFDKKK